MSALFSKKTKDEKKKAVSQKSEVVLEENKQAASFGPVSESVITGFYISEKAGLLNNFNQYVFKVSSKANKSQLARQVEKMFSVKVKGIKVLNTAEKRRNVGRHSGSKPGFKKAIVVLEKGYSIEQAR